MTYEFLSGTGLKISRLSLGTMTFGSQVKEEDALKMCSFAFDEGINHIDTANVYNNAESERIVGKAIKGRRDKLVLATKVGLPMPGEDNETNLSRGYLIKQLDDSLMRLQTDYIDIYYLHAPDYNTPIEETLETVTGFIRSGKIRYVGVSNFAAWQVCQMFHEAFKGRLIQPRVSQVVYNMLTRGIEQEYVPFAKAYNIGLVAYNPLAGGLLSGKYSKNSKAVCENTRFAINKVYYNRYFNDENLDAVERLEEISLKEGISILELAMRWLISKEQVASILLGFSSMEQLSQNLTSIDKGALSDDVLKSIDEIWESLKGNRFQYNR